MLKYQLEDFLQHASELSTISPIAVELINIINATTTTRKVIADLVAKDEVLFTNVFKYVNSAAFASVRRPENLDQAIALLGTNEVRNIVFGVAAKKVFLDLDLWYRSVFTAFAAQKFAKTRDFTQEEVSNIYIVGLLKSLGKQIFAMFYQDDYAEVEECRGYEEKLKKEAEVFGINSIELTSEIVKDYGLPQAITDTLKTQACLWDQGTFTQPNAIIRLASCLADMDLEEIDEATIDKTINRSMMSKFDLEDLTLNEEVIQELNSDTKAFVKM